MICRFQLTVYPLAVLATDLQKLAVLQGDKRLLQFYQMMIMIDYSCAVARIVGSRKSRQQRSWPNYIKKNEN